MRLAGGSRGPGWRASAGDGGLGWEDGLGCEGIRFSLSFAVALRTPM